MKSTFVLAQTASALAPEENLNKAEELLRRAGACCRPDLVIFPEYFMSSYPMKRNRDPLASTAQPLDGPFVRGMRELARSNGVWLLFGMNEQTEDPADSREYNTSVLINQEGEVVATYRKTHLYDAFGFVESESIKPGDRLFEPVDTPFGRLGLFVCYELRFPEVARFQRAGGAELILVPTAWAAGKLKSHHFRTLVTARALENTVYLLACDQCGPGNIGESLAVDPMGVPIAAGAEEECLVVVPVDTDRLARAREVVPSYDSRRPELYPL